MWVQILGLVVVTGALAMVFRRPSELFGTIVCTGLTALTLVVPGGRVLTIPLVIVLVMIWLFWAARRSAEREEL